MNDNRSPVHIVDQLGRIVLPAQARSVLGWNEHTWVELLVDAGNSRVIIKTHRPTCVHCGSATDLLSYRGRPICKACRDKISTLAET